MEIAVPVTQSYVGQVHTLRNAAGGLFRGRVLAVTGGGAIVEVRTTHRETETITLKNAEIVTGEKGE